MSKYVKNFGEYNVKNVKSFSGREGLGYNCSLYRGSKRIGFCIDDASGGGMYPIEWELGSDRKEEEALFNAHIKSLPKAKCGEGFPKDTVLSIDAGWFIEELVNETSLQKDIKKLQKKCQTSTLYRSSRHKRGAYSEISVPYTKEIKEELISKHGENVEIFNDVLAEGKVPSVFSE